MEDVRETRRAVGATAQTSLAVMIKRGSVVDRLSCRDVLHALGFPAPRIGHLMRCPLPGHDDSSPSFKLVGVGETGFRCFGCNAHGGCLDLPVALGVARDRAEAARLLEDRFQ